MSNRIFPIISIILAVAIYTFFINPLVSLVGGKNIKLAELESVKEQIKAFNDTRDILLEKYNKISSNDLEKLDTIFPIETDPVAVALEIKKLTESNGLSLQGNVNILDNKTGKIENPDNIIYGDKIIKMTELNIRVGGSYQSLLSFLSDLSNSLRLINVSSLSFTALSSEDLSLNNLYLFNLTLNLFFQNG